MNTKTNTKDVIRTACSTLTKQLAYNAAKKTVCVADFTSLSPAMVVLVNVVLSDVAVSKLFDD